MIKIALVDDHVILRKSLAILIEMFPDFQIILQASNGQDFIDRLKQSEIPDIVLLDITMPVMDGVETARWLKENHPQVKVLALSMIKNDFIVIRMLKNGARGYILKDSDPAELKDALISVYTKGYYYNELITPRMKSREAFQDDLPKMMLTEQELIFLRWACTEKSHKQIADEMNISPRTVDGYPDSLFKKLDVGSRVGIAIYAIRNGIVQL
jgi:two-component system invasion response regulator UvrY